LAAIHALYALDDALAERSGFGTAHRPATETTGDGDAQ
jgi:hypothetical protein